MDLDFSTVLASTVPLLDPLALATELHAWLPRRP
jgi:hypothetical protein